LSAVPASNITTTTNAKGGVTKSYLVPTKTLPLVALNPRLKAQEATLRKQIDAAYIRNDPKKTAAATTVAGLAPAPADAVSVPKVAAEPVTVPKVAAEPVSVPKVAAAAGSPRSEAGTGRAEARNARGR
jgi:hypothetical protein